MKCDNFDILDSRWKEFSENRQYDFILIDEVSSTIGAWAAVICALLGTLGNTLTIIVFLKKPILRSHATTPFLLSLAFSDFAMSAFNMPLLADRYFHRRWRFKWCSCQLFAFWYYANVSISALSMSGVALNRFVGLFFPQKLTSWFTLTKSCGLITIFWSYSLGFMTLPFGKIWGRLGYEPQTFSCTILEHEGKDPLFFFLSMGFGLPMAVITICYMSIFIKVKLIGKEIRNVLNDANAELAMSIQQRDAQITKMTLMIWLGYLTCFFPTFLIMMINPMPPNGELPGLHIAGYITFWCSCFINPFIYIACNELYRKALLEVVFPSFFNFIKKLPFPIWQRRTNHSNNLEQIELQFSSNQTSKTQPSAIDSGIH